MLNILFFRKFFLTSLGIFFALILQFGISSAAFEPSENDEGLEVLTDGPIHEAFAEVTVNKTVVPIVISSSVPEPINEIPPDFRPDGDRVEWIAGYWSWDEDYEDFIWVSGVWRDVPPDLKWVSGYWMTVDGGHQYIPGYWVQADVTETVYLPPPPEPLETGPSSPSVSTNHVWMQGNWIWHDNRYAWQPGYWYELRSDMVWVPGHYVWTHRGHIYVRGYWDYQLAHRGVMYAPLHYTRPLYRNYGYYYTPRIALDFDTVYLSLFTRKGMHHYYFGNYHHSRYVNRGFLPWSSRYATRHGYDPNYRSHRSQHLRYDREWEIKYHRQVQSRRNHLAAGSQQRYRTGKKRDFVQPRGPANHLGSKRHVVVGKNNRKNVRSNVLKKKYQRKPRLQERKSTRFVVERRKIERVPSENRKFKKTVGKKKYVQQKRATISPKRLKNQKGGRRFTKMDGNRSQTVQSGRFQPDNKKKFQSKDRRTNKRVVARNKFERVNFQENPSWKPNKKAKIVQQNKSVNLKKKKIGEASVVSRRSEVKVKGRNRDRSHGQIKSGQRPGPRWRKS